MTSTAPAMSPSDIPIDEVLDRATGPRREEADELVNLLQSVLEEQPVVWAGRIIGFGEYQYTYDSGHSGTAPLLAFAPGKAHHTVYLANNFSEKWPDLISLLGPHRASKACLYITRLSKVNVDALKQLLQRSLAETLRQYA